MRTLPRLVPSLSVATVAAAVALSACGPSIDPAAKADIDRRVSVLQPGPNAVPAPAPGMFAPMPFAVGQWTQYKMMNDKNEPSFITYKVVGQDGDAVWLEIVNESYTGRTIQKMLVAFGSRMDPNQVEIRAVSTKDAKGRVQEMPPPVISMMQSTYPRRRLDADHQLAGAAARVRERPGRPLRRLLQGAHRRAVGPLPQRRRLVVAPGRAAFGRRAIAGGRPPFHHGIGRLRDQRRRQRVLSRRPPVQVDGRPGGARLSRAGAPR